MANPNIVNVTDIRGKTAVTNITTSATTLVENSAASNKVFKINGLIISNINVSSNIPFSFQIFNIFSGSIGCNLSQGLFKI